MIRRTGEDAACATAEDHIAAAKVRIPSFARSLAAHPLELAALRRALGLYSRVEPVEAIGQIQRLLESGQLKLIRCPIVRGGGGGGAIEGSGGEDGDDADSSSSSRKGGSKSGTPARVKTWIEITLVDEDGEPVPYEPFEIELPDGRKVGGRLDGNGLARFSNIDPGTCQVSFPEIDGGEWNPN